MLEHLRRHDWPGNVRELGHFADRYALGLGALDLSAPEVVTTGTLAEQVDRFERSLIREELIMAGGDVRVAAGILGHAAQDPLRQDRPARPDADRLSLRPRDGRITRFQNIGRPERVAEGLAERGPPVTRYYIDSDDNDRTVIDEAGFELSGPLEARSMAIDVLPDMAREKLPDGDRRTFSVRVRDDGGHRDLQRRTDHGRASGTFPHPNPA